MDILEYYSKRKVGRYTQSTARSDSGSIRSALPSLRRAVHWSIPLRLLDARLAAARWIMRMFPRSLSNMFDSIESEVLGSRHERFRTAWLHSVRPVA